MCNVAQVPPKKAMSLEKKHFEVSPTDYLSDSFATQNGDGVESCLIILNQPIADIEVLGRLWRHTIYRLCADGGANQLFDLFKDRTELRSKFLPDIIHGDLDSLRNDVRQYYQDQGVKVTKDPDQYSTDFGKGIKQILRDEPSVRHFLVLGTIAGRLDQGIGLLGEMYREQHSEHHPGIRLWLFSESSISFILDTGKTVIQTPLEEGIITRNVGILPIYGPAHISTQGLEWDVENWPTHMGGQVSSSNHIVADQIIIEADSEVLFTVERNCKVAG